MAEELGPPAPWAGRIFRLFTLERGIIIGLVLVGAGAVLIGWITLRWAGLGFGPLDPEVTMRPVVSGATLIALGFQTIFMSFVYSMLGIQKKKVS
jgi:hypothetical protein